MRALGREARLLLYGLLLGARDIERTSGRDALGASDPVRARLRGATHGVLVGTSSDISVLQEVSGRVVGRWK